MTPAQKNCIVNNVNSIHSNREIVKKKESEISHIKEEMDRITGMTLQILDDLKRYMGDQTTINIKIEDKYYTLIQRGGTVTIDRLIIDIN